MGSGSSDVTTGYWYGIGLHMAICYGPVDAITEIASDDRPFYTSPITGNAAIGISARNLFGGEEREGGIEGSLWVAMGGPTQTKNGYLQSQLGTHIPAFRGVLTLIYKGLISANNPYIKGWSLKLRRILQGWNGGTPWYSAKAEVGSGDMNPAHIVYQCLTDPDWGMGYPTSAIDDANFRAVADKLYNEGFGLSLPWNQTGSIENFVKIIMDHIGGTLRVDPSTGKFIVKLIRADYDPGALDTYGPSQITAIQSYQRAAWGETVNEVTVVYTDPATFNDTGITVQDLANIQSQGSVVSQRINYPGIRNAALAQRVAMRDLIARATPLAKVKFTVNRTAWSLLPGDVFKLTWPKFGISGVVYRVLNLSMGERDNNLITVDAAEDVFGLPDSTYSAQEPVGWQEPGSVPAPSPNRKVIETPYFQLVRSLSPADLAYLAPLDGYLQVMAQKPAGDAYNYRLNTRLSGGTYADRAGGRHTPTATLNGGIAQKAATTTINYTGAVDDDLVAVGDELLIDDEWMTVASIDTSTQTITAHRGIFDSVPAAHADGARIWFPRGYSATDGVLYVDGEVVQVKVQTRTTRGLLDLGDAPEDSVTINQRQARPYPPGKVLINGVAYPTVITGPLYVSWAHRDRVLQADQPVLQTDGSVGPEAGTTYRVAIVGEGSTTTSGTDFSWCAPTTSSSITITLGSTRDGLYSAQDHSITIERAGWGYNWGKYWGGHPSAADGTSLVRCAEPWVYLVQVDDSGVEIMQRFYSGAAYVQEGRNTGSHYYSMRWVNSAGATVTSKTLGYRVTEIPVHDATNSCYWYGLNQSSMDDPGNQQIGFAKIADDGSGSPVYYTGDITYNVGAVNLFSGKVWVGDGDLTHFLLKRFNAATGALVDTTTLEGTPYFSTTQGSRIYMLLVGSSPADNVVVAYDASLSRQWVTATPHCIGLVYANGYLWTVSGVGGYHLMRLDLSGSIDTYSLSLPAGFTYHDLSPLALCGGYLVVGAQNGATKPTIVDPVTGAAIPRN